MVSWSAYRSAILSDRQREVDVLALRGTGRIAVFYLSSVLRGVTGMNNVSEGADSPIKQRPEYETPTVISLTRVQTGKGQQATCSPGNNAEVDCTNGYGAFSSCEPLGLSAGGGCTTGDGHTI